MPRGRGGRHGRNDKERGALLAAGAELTLAQHLGLIPKPDPLLTEKEWNQVHLTARLHFRSTTDCAICREGFKEEQQVLLSCSHVFHSSCIAAVRGWLARKRVRELRKHNPPQDPRLLRRWAAERLEDESNKWINDMSKEQGDLDDLFAEFDQSLAISRSIFSQVPNPHHSRWQQGIEAGDASRLQQLGPWAHDGEFAHLSDSLDLVGGEETQVEGAAPTTVDPAFSSSSSSLAQLHQSSMAPAAALAAFSGHSGAPDVDWGTVMKEALSRKEIECPICIGALNRNGQRGIAWLSCTHCFHEECIATFEAFELSQGGLPSCPVCRANYQRRCFQ
ncbi:hypothetical protein DUNSADRAFT_10849 [Dunaliella salina]|uniref:RING-type domain-containing protein n=1 Tax=Dunaliella salina TaxID=3046 RepID=A0ABQ7H9Z1_DUNSA|nr:hypothetical protein DUNSADRAFT_10849 [Dunaliella salina]|eukprot:KAF5843673.1 hypothetical protein DUNSADRAFT_10849 [Dunaliella salina]